MANGALGKAAFGIPANVLMFMLADDSLSAEVKHTMIDWFLRTDLISESDLRLLSWAKRIWDKIEVLHDKNV